MDYEDEKIEKAKNLFCPIIKAKCKGDGCMFFDADGDRKHEYIWYCAFLQALSSIEHLSSELKELNKNLSS